MFFPAPNLEAQVRKESKLQASLDEVASEGLEFARTHVPVDTGELQGSLHIERVGDGRRIVAGTDHWLFPEYGTSEMPATPYLRPTLTALGLKVT